jgi:hypothetical protein
MKWLVFLLSISIPIPALADPACTTQDYTKEKPAPNFDCPSPLEETLVPNPEVGPKASVALTATKPAPWDGILVDKDRLIQLGLRITALRRLRWMDTLKAQDVLAAEKKLITDSKKADLDLITSQRESYKAQLVQTQKELSKATAWYRSWTFGLIVGAVTTSAVAITLAYVARQ